ncbi:MAG: hypothetical protein AAGF19_01530, partial [Pseudomonadota bacterium]
MRFEVEDLMGDDFFVVQDTDVPFASEQAVGRVILRREASDDGLTFTEGQEAQADTTFTGPRANYAVKIAAFDENDGVGSVGFSVNDVVIQEFTLDDASGPGFPSPGNDVIFMLDNPVLLNPGDDIGVVLTQDSGEFVRADYFDLVFDSFADSGSYLIPLGGGDAGGLEAII